MNAQMILLYLIAAFTEPQRPDPMVATVREMTPAGVAAPMPPAVQASPAAVAEPHQHRHEKKWHDLSNAPGWQGYGVLNSNGWLISERFRTKDSHKVWEGAVVPYGAPVAAPPPASCSPGMACVSPVASSGDPYGFVAYLNGVRSRSGLGAVAWDDNLAWWATENSRVGFGHFVRCGRRQNAGQGPDLWTVAAMWLGHGPHADAMLDPTITRVGLGCVGNCFTYNAD